MCLMIEDCFGSTVAALKDRLKKGRERDGISIKVKANNHGGGNASSAKGENKLTSLMVLSQDALRKESFLTKFQFTEKTSR